LSPLRRMTTPFSFSKAKRIFKTASRPVKPDERDRYQKPCRDPGDVKSQKPVTSRRPRIENQWDRGTGRGKGLMGDFARGGKKMVRDHAQILHWTFDQERKTRRRGARHLRGAKRGLIR